MLVRVPITQQDGGASVRDIKWLTLAGLVFATAGFAGGMFGLAIGLPLALFGLTLIVLDK